MNRELLIFRHRKFEDYLKCGRLEHGFLYQRFCSIKCRVYANRQAKHHQRKP